MFEAKASSDPSGEYTEPEKPTMQKIKVAIVEDQQTTREGLAILIGNAPGFEITGRYASVEQALESLEANPPQVLLMDIGLPGMTGIE